MEYESNEDANNANKTKKNAGNKQHKESLIHSSLMLNKEDSPGLCESPSQKGNLNMTFNLNQGQNQNQCQLDENIESFNKSQNIIENKEQKDIITLKQIQEEEPQESQNPMYYEIREAIQLLKPVPKKVEEKKRLELTNDYIQDEGMKLALEQLNAMKKRLGEAAEESDNSFD